MDLPTLVLVAFALSFDTLAVSIACGVTVRRQRSAQALRMAAVFGAFHAVMPGLGWLAGKNLADAISGSDHWIAFGLLVGVGAKMIYEAMKLEEVCTPRDPFRGPVLFVLGFATSIDALAMGVTFAFLGMDIIAPALVIGGIIFAVSFLGTFVGKAVGHIFERWVEVAGGLILIGIGSRILFEHMA